MTEALRSCAQCGAALPASARSMRLYCSSRCRYRAWDAANRFAAPVRPPVRLHWHVDRYSVLTGNVEEGYWREDGCPPECPGLTDGGWSMGVPTGKDGLHPSRDWFRRPLRALH